LREDHKKTLVSPCGNSIAEHHVYVKTARVTHYHSFSKTRHDVAVKKHSCSIVRSCDSQMRPWRLNFWTANYRILHCWKWHFQRHDGCWFWDGQSKSLVVKTRGVMSCVTQIGFCRRLTSSKGSDAHILAMRMFNTDYPRLVSR
jgi:hypothetical protein